KWRSVGVIVPLRSWSGLNDAPVTWPIGVRAGCSNGDLMLVAEVGWPGVLGGPWAPEGVARASSPRIESGGLPSSTAPAVAAVPASKARRVIAGEPPPASFVMAVASWPVLRILLRRGCYDTTRGPAPPEGERRGDDSRGRHLLLSDGHFARLRGEPRYVALIRRV